MDTKYVANLIIFLLYSILHFSIISNIVNEIAKGKNISVGIFFIIAGVWGLCINRFLLKIFFLEKKPKVVNSLLIIFGIILLVYTLII
jgi:hypothetical protein